MMIKKFAAVMAAAVMAMASVPCAFADWGYDNGYDNGYNTYDNNTYDNGNTGYDNNGWTADNGADNGAVTTAPAGDGPAETSVETAGNVVTSMGATTTSDKPTSAPSRVYLQTSEIKDDIVTAELRIEADAVVSEALVSVTFDTNSLQLVGTAINEEAGGKAEETTFNGKYVLNYTNDLGSNFKEKIQKMAQVEELTKKFPGIDCGSCGAPSCRALAEDIARGEAKETDCIHKLKAKIQSVYDQLGNL